MAEFTFGKRFQGLEATNAVGHGDVGAPRTYVNAHWTATATNADSDADRESSRDRLQIRCRPDDGSSTTVNMAGASIKGMIFRKICLVADE
jgi:hypothetical protein